MNSNVFLLFGKMALQHPERLAVVYQGREISYRALLDETLAISALIRSLGAKAGDRVMMFSPNAPEYLSVMMGVAHAGCIFAPVNDDFRERELTYIVANAKADLAFIHAGSADDFFRNSSGASDLPAKIILFGEGPAIDHPRIIGHLGAMPKGADLAAPFDCRPETPCLIVYTSGSTAVPKGVLHSHGSTGYAMTTYASMWDYRLGDHGVVTPPMSWVFGLLLTSAAMLTVGSTIVLLPRFHPVRQLEAIEKFEAKLCFGTMSMYTKMLDVLSRQDFDLSSLRFCMVGGEPCPESAVRPVEARFKRRLSQAWAFSENHPLVAMRAGDTDAPVGSAGRPAPDVAIRLCDPDGKPVEPGLPGEAWVRGPGAMLCYFRNPELTAEKVDRDGWIRTGDLMQQDAAGYITIVGRASDMIIRSGANIAPAEVETALLDCPGIAAACVVGIPDRLSGEATVAYVVRDPDKPAVHAENLLVPLAARLAKYKIPQEYVFVDDLPFTANGKLDRARLKTQAAEMFRRYAAPAGS